ncbi:MAG: PKD domain-containing protein, partial [Bacteroidales bacterium]|nr:PKD domain-containing protein [Bacteroidales bacterium]
MIGFSLPGIVISGFYSPLGFNCNGSSLPPNGDAPIVYMQDDSWGGVSSDHLKIWTIDVNWSSPGSSTISSPQSISTAAFESVFDGGSFSNLPQPSGSDIDALQATIMYMAQYRRFGGYNSAVLNFVVDLNSNDDYAGIRWYELRQNNDGDPWYIYQEGTYSQPGNRSVFSGNMCMDASGNIALAYTTVSTSVYPSLRYTGRYAADPLGTMTMAEEVIGNGNQSDPSYRYGDYSQMTIDPTDDATFWSIGEYFPNGTRTNRVGVFQFAAPALNAEFSGTPTNVCANGTVSFTDLSMGSPNSWSWSFPGGSPSSYNGQNPPLITYSIPGEYDVTLTVSDGSSNDTEPKNNYITVNNIVADFSGSPTTVLVGNSVTFTDNSLCNPTSWSWSFPGGTPNSFNGQNPPAITYNTTGTYNVSLSVSNGSGNDTETKTNYINVINCTYCPSTYSNTTDDWITNVTFNSINNNSGQGGPDSYEDFTSVSTSVTPGNTYPVSVSLEVGSPSWIQHCVIYIDWNQNCDFTDAGESYDLDDVSGPGTMNSNIAVPAGALTGTTIMRVCERYNQNPGPCDVSTYGEVEDYTVNITGGTAPSCTSPASPVNGSTNVSLNTSLSWNAASGATGYYIYFGTNNPPTNIENGTDLGNVTSYSPAGALNTGTTYYWRIVPYNSYGQATGCSVWSFTTGNPPGCTTPVSPGNGSTGVLITSTLSWNNAAGATGYMIYFGTNNPPTNIENGIDLGNVTTYTPSPSLSFSTAYYWKIVPYNSFGLATGCSVWNFSTEAGSAPSCTTPVSPANGATNTPITTSLTWNSAASATGYYIYFGTDSPPTNIANGTDLGNTTTYTPPANLNFNTLYYWQVIPYNGFGSGSGCAIWSFTTTGLSYCVPTYSTGTSWGDYISLVQLGSINNSTGALSSPYYQYYSSLSTNLDAGGSYTLTVSAGTYSSGNNITAWIDYNQDGTFEEAERLGHVTLGAMPETGNMNFSVPVNALTGNTRIRVREVWNQDPIDPCNNYNYGETEDYNINIVSGIELNVKVFVEGPYNPLTHLMIPELNPAYVPLAQPYNVAPWNYNGPESVANLPNASVVDWILIELRDAPNVISANSASMIERQAAFILNDGSVVNIDGTSNPTFSSSVNY